MKTKNLFFALLALVVSLPALANTEYTYTDPNGVVWTYEFVDETDPSQGIVITSSISTTDELVLPLEINDGDTTLPVVGISLSLSGFTSIPDNYFQGCSNLTSVVIPNTVTSIGENAFNGCSSLSSFTIPNTVTRIGANAFRGCSSLSSITIPHSVIEIGGGAFGNCSSLTSVTYSEGMTYIPDWCFENVVNLTSFTIPNSVTRIDGGAFWNCASLTSIVFPNQVTTIGPSAFGNCFDLTSIVFPESVTTISEGAFWGCGLTSVTIPKSVTMIESFAFRGCRSLTSIVVNGDNPVYDSRDNCNAIIETASNTLLQGFKCTEIPATVTKIANGAFCGLGLTSFYIPENITEIEGNPFQDWDSFDITSIEVAEGNPVYDSRDNCNAIIETSTNTMLMGCINTTFPSSVTNIGEYAFRNCGYLTSIVIPSSITSIGNEAFTGCNNLSSVTFSEGLVSIGAGAFYDIPITSITIPSSVTSIGVAAFGHANERNRTVEIVVNEGNTVYDSRNNCNAIIETSTNTLLNGCENTVIPSSVSHIGDWAFGPCEFTAITNDPSQAGGGCFYIPSSVTSIGHGAFFNNYSLTTFALPENLTELGEDALGGGVTSLISTRTNPFFLDPNIGIGVAMNCVLHVPAGTKASYIAAGWTEEVFGGGIVEDGEAAPDFVSVSLSSVGASTFCSKYNLDFSGTEDIKAYIVSAFTPSTGEATLTRIKYVPALTGIVLLGNEGAYDIPVTDKQTVVANLLVGVTGRTQLSRNEGRYTNFVLANGSSGLGFYTVVDGSTLAANRAYLPLLTYLLPTSASSISIRFDDDATMIDDMEAEGETTAWHDLSGRTLNELPSAKGVYIVNGKKVVVK